MAPKKCAHRIAALPAGLAQGWAGFRSLGRAFRPTGRRAGGGGAQTGGLSGTPPKARRAHGGRRPGTDAAPPDFEAPAKAESRTGVFGGLQFVSVAFRTTMFPHGLPNKAGNELTGLRIGPLLFKSSKKHTNVPAPGKLEHWFMRREVVRFPS